VVSNNVAASFFAFYLLLLFLNSLLMTDDKVWMNRCLELARLGEGLVAPNPLVGSVVVYDGRIIGEGWHRKFGGNHAEVNAIESVKNKSLLAHSILYVNLEPCSHFGKTPPCANLLIKYKIPKVVIGMVDPNPQVAGKGVELLRNAGVEVVLDVLNEEAVLLNKRFIKYYLQKKPYVVLKWAQTQNGMLSPDAKKMSKQDFERERHITGFLVQKLVHKWRTVEDAIMVGTNTALTDNPALDARAWVGKNPVRVIIDNNLRLPRDLKIFSQNQRTLIFNSTKNEVFENLQFVKIDFLGNWFSELLSCLYEMKIQSLIIEGGSQLLHSILEGDLWDEAIVFYSPKHISKGIQAPSIYGKIIQQQEFDGVQMTQYKRQ
jgi:diaminohydroxyphosphoribosylaminopyrimidine deaminase/5-amino-6-(5-phosphoribosylamino)uracil reductase